MTFFEWLMKQKARPHDVGFAARMHEDSARAS
jgi:hypothetical protein